MESLAVKAVVIDQNGDTIITLTKLEAEFATWQPVLYHAGNKNGLSKGTENSSLHQPDVVEIPIADTCTTIRKESKKDRMMRLRRERRERQEEEERLAQEVEEVEEAARRVEEEATAALIAESNSLPDEVGDASPDHSALIQSSNSAANQCSRPSEDFLPDVKPSAEAEMAVEYRVSSKHLEMASGKFRSELSGTWGESNKREDGLYHLTAEDWNPEIFSILLNVLHLRNRHVPSSLTLEKLAKIAVLVDYYRCWDAVAVWTKIWIPEVKKKEPVPSSYSRELIMWMLIAWVFELPKDFNTTTRTAIRQSQTPTIQDMYLPIPPVVLEAMELRRYEAIDTIISICHDWICRFCDNYKCPQSYHYSFSCGSILLGNLIKGMRNFGYLWPRPQIPFEGYSFEDVCKGLKELQSPEDFHSCTLQDAIGGDIGSIAASTDGLRLQDFKDRAKELEQL